MASRKARTYMRVVFETPAAIADEAASVLITHGALGCAVAKTVRSHPGRRTRKSVRLEAWFEQLSGAALRRIMEALEAGGMLVRNLSLIHI